MADEFKHTAATGTPYSSVNTAIHRTTITAPTPSTAIHHTTVATPTPTTAIHRTTVAVPAEIPAAPTP